MESRQSKKTKGTLKSWFTSKVDKLKSKMSENKHLDRDIQRGNLEIYDLDSESRACKLPSYVLNM